MRAGTDIAAIQDSWGGKFTNLDWAEDWQFVQDTVEQLPAQTRWGYIHRKILKHETGVHIAITYAVDPEDDSAPAYPDTWCYVEPYEETVTKYRIVEHQSPSGESRTST